MTESSGAETLRTKQEFETFVASIGIQILHYHADSGHFRESIFIDDVKLNAQTFSICAINTHQQNGFVERHRTNKTKETFGHSWSY